jgi:hypothetical protein
MTNEDKILLETVAKVGATLPQLDDLTGHWATRIDDAIGAALVAWDDLNKWYCPTKAGRAFLNGNRAEARNTQWARAERARMAGSN